MTLSIDRPRTYLRSLVAAATLTLISFSGPAESENWPHWRGPSLDSTSRETSLPSVWSWTREGSDNVHWRVELPGPAGSSPIVWEDRIFVTSTNSENQDLVLLSFDRGGRRIWSQVADQGSVSVMQQFAHETNAAASSPVTDGTRVIALFGTGKLFAFETETGDHLWTVDLAARYGKPNLYFGLSTSPLLREDRVFVQLLHSDAQLVVALDAATGAEIWKQERATDAAGECLHAYTSVVPFRGSAADDDALLVHGSDYLSAHEYASGAERWRFGTLNPKENYNSMFRLVSTPISAAGLVVVPTAKRGPVFAIRPGKGRASIAPEALVWKLDRGTPDVPSPLIADGLVYLSGENGRLTAVDADSGETLYAERVHQGQHRGSPVLADGKVYLSAADGTVSVIRAGRTFELLSKNTVETERMAASPAISRGKIYLRTYEALFSIGED